MKNNYKLTFIVLILILGGIPVSSVSAERINSGDLIKHAREYDGKIITYCGEAIGDVMLRGKYAWVNVNDGDNALGVWMPDSMAKEIKFTGNYKTQGDNLEITGVFNRACLEHGGDMDIHAQKMHKLKPGCGIDRKLPAGKKKVSLILLGALLLIWILTLFRRKQKTI